ncbi:hypothetical protein [Methylobacterium organophilum]|uniref:Uncharacterized protein n=1 Tax=Methylobacterium organophilum TaxID=410 RepID=A0ABQ4T1H5_METOR|nr:hypothetical protein [Methylobacterium organophilum]UMY18982.1 hypothetical protein MMB17_06680 [Methylobacterium organophilum]GJE25486.1 hypothetical protein LKMONMHP_0324 [Methylobacterium organophilum]
MGAMAIGLGAALCGGGALAHFYDRTQRKEGVLALGGFCFLLAGLFLTRY